MYVVRRKKTQKYTFYFMQNAVFEKIWRFCIDKDILFEYNVMCKPVIKSSN